MKKIIKITSLLCFLICYSANSTHFNIDNIKIHGLKSYSEKFILKCLSQHDNFESKNVFDNLNSLHLFNSIKVSIQNDNLNIFVVEKLRIIKTNIIGDIDQEIPTILSGFHFFNGNLLNYDDLKVFRKNIETFCYKNGFFNYHLDISLSLHKKNNTVIINIKYFRNKQFVLKKVIFNGIKDLSIEKKMITFVLPNITLINLFNKNYYNIYKITTSLKNVKDYFNNIGYINFKVESIKYLLNNKRHTMIAIVEIEENEQYIIDNIYLNYDNKNELLYNEIFTLIKTDIKKNDYVSSIILMNLIKKINVLLNTHDIFNIKCAFTFNKSINNNINIIFSVNHSHNIFKIKKINLLGIPDNLKQLYKTLINQSENDYLSNTLMEQAKQIMIKKGYASEVDIIYNNYLDNYTDVTFKIKQSSASLFSLTGGLSQRHGLTLNFTCDLLNCLNSGNDLLIRINKTKKITDSNISYVISNFRQSNFELTYSIFMKREKLYRSYLNKMFGPMKSFGATTSALYKINDKVQIMLSLGFDKLTTKGPTKKAMPTIVKYRTKYDKSNTDCVLGTVLMYNSLNNKDIPTCGMFHKIDLKIMIPSSSILYGTLLYDFKIFGEINTNYYLSFTGGIAYAKKYLGGVQYPYGKFFILKGEHVMRGYRGKFLGPRDVLNKPIGGNLSMSFKTSIFFTASFFNNLNIRPSIFLDIGQVFITDNKFVSRPRVTIPRRVKTRSKPSRYKLLYKKHQGILVREKLQRQLDMRITSDYIIKQLLLHKKELLNLESKLMTDKHNTKYIRTKSNFLDEYNTNKLDYNNSLINLNNKNLLNKNITEESITISSHESLNNSQIILNDNSLEYDINLIINMSYDIISQFKTMYSINNLLKNESSKIKSYNFFNVNYTNDIDLLYNQNITLLNKTYSDILFSENIITEISDLLEENESPMIHHNYNILNKIKIKNNNDIKLNDINTQKKILNKYNLLQFNNKTKFFDYFINDNLIKFDTNFDMTIIQSKIIHPLKLMDKEKKNITNIDIDIDKLFINAININNDINIACLIQTIKKDNKILCKNNNFKKNINHPLKIIKNIITLDEALNIRDFVEHKFNFRLEKHIPFYIPGAAEEFARRCDQRLEYEDENDVKFFEAIIKEYDIVDNVEILNEIKLTEKKKARKKAKKKAEQEVIQKAEKKIKEVNQNIEVFQQKFLVKELPDIVWTVLLNHESKKISMSIKTRRLAAICSKKTYNKIIITNKFKKIVSKDKYAGYMFTNEWPIKLMLSNKKILKYKLLEKTNLSNKNILQNKVSDELSNKNILQNEVSDVLSNRRILSNDVPEKWSNKMSIIREETNKLFHKSSLLNKNLSEEDYSKVTVLQSDLFLDMFPDKINVSKKKNRHKFSKAFKKRSSNYRFQNKLSNKTIVSKKKEVKQILVNKLPSELPEYNKKDIESAVINELSECNKKDIPEYNKKNIQRQNGNVKYKLIKKRFKRKRVRLNRLYKTGLKKCFRNKFMMGYRVKMDNLWRTYLLHQKENYQEKFLLKELNINTYNHSILKKDKTRNKKYGLMNFKTRKIYIKTKFMTVNIFKNDDNKLIDKRLFNTKLVYGHFMPKEYKRKISFLKLNEKSRMEKHVLLKNFTKILKKKSYIKKDVRQIKHKKKIKRYSTFFRLSCGISIGWTSPFGMPFEIIIAKAINPHPLEKTSPFVISLVAHQTEKKRSLK